MKRSLILLVGLLLTNIINAQHGDQDPYCFKPNALINQLKFQEADRADDGRFDIIYYNFDWKVNPSVQYIDGLVKIKLVSKQDGLSDIKLSLYKDLNVEDVQMNGNHLTVQREGDYGLNINLSTSLALNEIAELEIKYEGAPPSSGFGSFVTNKHGDGIPVLWTLSEPYGSQDWWPCKNGLTDKIDSMDVNITTVIGNKAVSNGLLVSVDTLDTLVKYHWKHRYPIVPYLVCMGVTNYEHFKNVATLNDQWPLEIHNYVYPESLSNAMTGTESLVNVIQWYDSLFYTYPFRKEKYGHAEFGWGGGEEHQTMTFVTNYDIGLLSHELAHQWFGDMVTCGSWEDIWLNEGFATYLEGIMRERFIPSTWFTWKRNKLNSITSQVGGSVFVTDTTSVNRIFSGRLTYNKGGYVLHMLRWLLGEKDFFQGIHNYLEDRQYDYAVTEQLQDHLEKVSGKDLDEFFKDWYTGQGYPSYTVDWAPSDVSNYIEVKITQRTSHNAVEFFEMPIPLLAKGDGVDTLLRLDNTVNGQVYLIKLPFECTSIEFDPSLWLISKDNVVNKLPTGVEHTIESEIQIFPTVVNHQLTVKNAAPGTTYTVYKLDGSVLLNGILQSSTASIDTQTLATGTYTILIGSEHKMMAKQLFHKIN